MSFFKLLFFVWLTSLTISPAWASKNGWNEFLKTCAGLLTGDLPWKSKLLDSKAFRQSGLDPKSVHPGDQKYIEIGKSSSGEFGLVILSNDSFSTAIFYVRLDRNRDLTSVKFLYEQNGRLGDWKKVFSEKVLAAKMIAAKEAPAISGDKAQIIYNATNVRFRRPFAISANGRFLAQVEGDSILVRDLESEKTAAQIPVADIDASTKDIWLENISDDGTLLSLVALDTPDDRFQIVYDIHGRKLLFHSSSDDWGFPKITIYQDTFTALYRKRLAIYSGGQLANTYYFPTEGQSGAGGLTLINQTSAAYLHPSSNEVLAIADGPQPHRWSTKGDIHPFTDGREDGAQEDAEHALNDLLKSLAAHKYSGLPGKYDVDSSWHYVVQERSQGSGLNFSFENNVDLFTTAGRFQGTVAPFYSVGSVGLSADGNWLAISESGQGPVWSPHKNRVWIYSTRDLLVPALRLEDIDVHTIDRLRFGANNRVLLIESVNSRVVLKFNLPKLR